MPKPDLDSLRIPIDLRRLAFSRFGAWTAWRLHTLRDGRERLCLQSLLSGHASLDLLALEPAEGWTFAASPAVLRARHPQGTLDICMDDPARIRLRLRGDLSLRLHLNINDNNLTPTADGNWRLIGWNLGCKFRTRLLRGALVRCAPAVTPLFDRGVVFELSADGDGEAELMLERYLTEAPPPVEAEDFDAAAERVAAEFRDYLAACPPAAGGPPETRAHAAYVNWSATVAPEGSVTRSAMLMSNNWMRNLWNWDTHFNAMALAAGHPDLAWESVQLFFGHQAPDGQLPGYLNNARIDYTRPQPPIHGWAFGWMLRHSDMLTPERIAWLYPRLHKLLDWWFSARDDGGSGFPFYVFPSDSGWDHCSSMQGNCPNHSPDLSADLVLMMHTLAAFAERLGDPAAARAWRERARAFLDAFLARFWDGRRFRSPHAYSGAENPGDCLLQYQPILLGEHLPPEIVRSIAEQLRDEGRFLTPHGLATESLRSELYIQDGYWRGAIWAPTLLMFIDGLRRAGEQDLSRDLAARFCRMCQGEGFPENFNATTGTALRDPAYTWTSSVYLLLATHYL